MAGWTCTPFGPILLPRSKETDAPLFPHLPKPGPRRSPRRPGPAVPFFAPPNQPPRGGEASLPSPDGEKVPPSLRLRAVSFVVLFLALATASRPPASSRAVPLSQAHSQWNDLGILWRRIFFVGWPSHHRWLQDSQDPASVMTLRILVSPAGPACGGGTPGSWRRLAASGQR